MYIEDLFQEINLETRDVEFKGTLEEGDNSQSDRLLDRLEYGWLKSVNAFANTIGGTLFVGVENKTHRIVSLNAQEVDKIVLRFHRLVKEHIHPEIEYEIETVPVKEEKQSRYLIKIRIKRSETLPVTMNVGGYNFIFIRYYGKNAPATPEQIRSLSLEGKNAVYDNRITKEVFEATRFRKLFQVYEEKQGKALSEKQLIDAGFMDKDHHLSIGAELFADDYAGDKTLLVATKIQGVNKGSDYFYQSKEIRGNLIDVLNQSVDFVNAHAANGFRKTSSGSLPYIAYPVQSLNEGIANALAHRNYFLDGTQIELNLYDDRLEIISPGSYPLGENITPSTDIATIAPGRRNEVICATLSLLGYIDKKGSGFDKIVEDYRGKGEAFRPFVSSSAAYFSLTLPDLTHEGGLVERNEFPEIHIPPLINNEKEITILRYCYAKSRTAMEIASYLGIAPSSYFRKDVLDKLVERGYLVVDESGRPAKYTTSRVNVIAR